MLLRCVVLAAVAVGAAVAQPQLAIVKPLLNQVEDEAGVPSGYRFVPGETIFFSFHVSGFKASEDKKIDLLAHVRAVDAKGVLLAEPVDKPIQTELMPEDKNWLPKVSTSIVVPVLIFPGTYRFLVSVEDKLANKTASLEAPFPVGGREVEPSDTLLIRNFRFLKSEDDTVPVKSGIYHPGETLWARFEIVGFRYGDRNHIKLTYGVRVINAAGREIYAEPKAATEDSESFYPRQYLPGTISLNFDKDVEKTGYTILVQVRDDIGNQTYEEKQPFKVE